MEEKLDLCEIHKEIDLLQSCITRMANNSFLLKGWLVSLYAVVLALLAEKLNVYFLLFILSMITISFWYLDTFFLRTEKIYRKFYEWVLVQRPLGNKELLYNLNPFHFQQVIEKPDNIRKVMFSTTLKWFYGLPMLIIILVGIFNALEPIIKCIIATYAK